VRNGHGTKRRAVGLAQFGGALLLTLALTFGPAGTTFSITPPPKITFGSPVVVDPTHAYGEPDVKIAPGGTNWYDSGPWGTGTQRSIWNWSADGGRTFHTLHAPAIASPQESDSTVPCPEEVPPNQCPGGGDTEISIDRRGKVYYSDLAALVTLKTATWDPSSRSMKTGLIADSDQGANGFDRQWFANWDPRTRPAGYTGPLPVNYLVYAEALAGCCQAGAYSLDGIDYTGPTVEYSIQNDGPAVIDQQTGTVLEAVSVDSLNDVGVAILTRDPSTPNDPALKKAVVTKIADLPPETNTRALFPVIALDRARNAYVAWVTRGDNGQSSSQDPNAWQIWYSYSTAASAWKTWSTPRKISAAPSNTNVMPWAVAGAGGRLAVVWYGTNDSTHDPSTSDVHQKWDVYLAMIAGAASSTPTIQQIKVTRHPMHYGTICLEGLGCILVQGNRNLADFFQVEMDPRNGAVVITYNDTSNEAIQEVPPIPDGMVDHRGAPLDMIVRQNGGVGLLGMNVSGDPTSGNAMTDSTGDAFFDPVYRTTPVPELDLTGVSVSTAPNAPHDLIFRLSAKSLDDLNHALVATGAQAVEWVVRWTGPPVTDPDTGLQNPIFYAAVEVRPGGIPTFFAGKAQSVDLCSVSACTPHIVNYPAPPQGGTLVAGQLNLSPDPGAPDSWIIQVPRSLVGSLGGGSPMESFSAFTLARNHPASLPITTAEGEAGITPVEIDGVCCREARA
jgi:hypothetical protein